MICVIRRKTRPRLLLSLGPNVPRHKDAQVLVAEMTCDQDDDCLAETEGKAVINASGSSVPT